MLTQYWEDGAPIYNISDLSNKPKLLKCYCYSKKSTSPELYSFICMGHCVSLFLTVSWQYILSLDNSNSLWTFLHEQHNTSHRSHDFITVLLLSLATGTRRQTIFSSNYHLSARAAVVPVYPPPPSRAPVFLHTFDETYICKPAGPRSPPPSADLTNRSPVSKLFSSRG